MGEKIFKHPTWFRSVLQLVNGKMFVHFFNALLVVVGVYMSIEKSIGFGIGFFVVWILGMLVLQEENAKTWKKITVGLIGFICIGFLIIRLNPVENRPSITSKGQASISETPKFIPEVTKIEKPEIKALKSKLTLLDLFKKDDFNSLLRASNDWEFKSKDGDKITIKSQVYSDPVSQTKFLGFYIPNNPKTFEICQSIVDMYKDVLEDDSRIAFETFSPELQPVNSSELNFSGRVFIYHEYFLFDAQKRKLYDLYKSRGLSIQFRGSEYLWEKKKAEKRDW